VSKRSNSRFLDAPPKWLGRPRVLCQQIFLEAVERGDQEVAIPRFLVLEGYGPEGHCQLANDATGWHFSHEGVAEMPGGAMGRAFVFVRQVVEAEAEMERRRA
jgi:hypothetical protein